MTNIAFLTMFSIINRRRELDCYLDATHHHCNTPTRSIASCTLLVLVPGLLCSTFLTMEEYCHALLNKIDSVVCRAVQYQRGQYYGYCCVSVPI